MDVQDRWEAGKLKRQFSAEPSLEYHPSLVFGSNLSFGRGTVFGGQFSWGGCLLKGNGGAQRSPQGGWKSPTECIGIRGLDCETYKSSRGRKSGKVILRLLVEGPWLNG